MRLWHDALLVILDKQRLSGQHRECCAMRGLGWGRKHSVVDYVWYHNYLTLFWYHTKVMDECKRRGIKIDHRWYDYKYRGKRVGYVDMDQLPNIQQHKDLYYSEHNDKYLVKCVELLMEKDVDYYYPIFKYGIVGRVG